MQRGKNLNISFFRFVTIHAFDGQTDRRTEFSSQDRVCMHSMQRGKKCAKNVVEFNKRLHGNISTFRNNHICLNYYRAAWNADAV